MFPDEPDFRKHPGTGETFWFEDCVEVAEEDWEEESKYPDIPYAEDVGIPDLEEELAHELFSSDREIYIRTQLWWSWNDCVRGGGQRGQMPDGFEANLRRLIELLNKEDDDSRLMAVEGLRELGEHDKAGELMKHPFPADFQMTVDVIREANERRDTSLLEIIC